MLNRMPRPARTGRAKRTARIERHHLVPRAYLHKLSIIDVRQVNQIANMALVDWNDNITIGDKSPSQYWPEQLAANGDERCRLRRADALACPVQGLDQAAVLRSSWNSGAGETRGGFDGSPAASSTGG